MKKIMYVLLSTMLLCSCMMFVACGSKENGEKETSDKTDAATTTVKQETETDETDTTVDDSKVTYKVKVVDADGNAIAGAMVQLCKDSCVPAVTNAEGVAEFNLEEDDYDVKFVQLPEGYTYSGADEVFKFEVGSFELTIILNAA